MSWVGSVRVPDSGGTVRGGQFLTCQYSIGHDGQYIIIIFEEKVYNF